MSDKTSVIKIGQLAKLAGILPSKVRYYVQQGLINPSERTKGGYFLFDAEGSLKRLKLIDELKAKKRLSLPEIRERLNPPKGR